MSTARTVTITAVGADRFDINVIGAYSRNIRRGTILAHTKILAAWLDTANTFPNRPHTFTL